MGRQFRFSHNYNTEATWDGGRLEVVVDGGASQELIAAGGTFISGGYNGEIRSNSGAALAGQPAWTGNSSGFVTTTIELPTSMVDKGVKLRWRFAQDSIVGADSWHIDWIERFANEAITSTFVIDEDKTLMARTLINGSWSDLREVYYFLDSDGDGLPDSAEEVLYGDPSTGSDGTTDLDNDGTTDLEEWLAGTDANDSSSIFRLFGQPASGSPENLMLQWPAVPGRVYRLWYSDSLELNSWTEIQGATVAEGTTMNYIAPQDTQHRFYRVQVSLQ